MDYTANSYISGCIRSTKNVEAYRPVLEGGRWVWGGVDGKAIASCVFYILFESYAWVLKTVVQCVTYLKWLINVVLSYFRL